jgi:uncharacterized protein (TIGR02453 family)
MVMAAMDEMRFEGFSTEGDRFFHELAVRQDRDWFKANKARYETLWVAPMKALLAELRPGLERAFKGMKLAPDKHFRLHRDLRFSKDKSPYKTFAAAMIKVDAGEGQDITDGGPAAIYMHLGTHDTIALGHWMLEGEQLAGYRRMLLDDKRGAAFARKAEALKRKGFTISAFETLKKPPRGVDPEHPLAWLLVHKGFGLNLPKPPAPVRNSPKLAKWILQHVKLAAPVVVELERARRKW